MFNEKIIEKIKRNKILYLCFKPLGKLYDFLIYLPSLPIRIKKWRTYTILPILRRLFPNRERKKIKSYHNIHQGKRIFIIASGPSVRMEDVDKLKDEIVIVLNGSILLFEKLEWDPKYYCVSDSEVIEKFMHEVGKYSIDASFVGFSNRKIMRKYHTNVVFYDEYMRDTLFPFNIKRVKKHMAFSDDLYKYGVYMGGRSITTAAVQLAAYMGATEIYLYGTDCDYQSAGNHFYDANEADAIPLDDTTFTAAMFAFFSHAQKVSENCDFKIYNATRGGKLEIFTRKNFDDIEFEENNDKEN